MRANIFITIEKRKSALDTRDLYGTLLAIAPINLTDAINSVLIYGEIDAAKIQEILPPCYAYGEQITVAITLT